MKKETPAQDFERLDENFVERIKSAPANKPPMSLDAFKEWLRSIR